MNTLLSIINKFDSTSILVIGDIMLDIYVYGTIDRISPEAPIPILKVGNKKEMLGGAGNVIANLSTLQARSSIISLIGSDASGKKITDLLGSLANVKSHLIEQAYTPTVTKTRFISGSQQVLRTDVEEIIAFDESIEQKILNKVDEIVDHHTLIILSDYKKGTLSKTICQAVIATAKAKNIPVFVDPKGKDYSIYKGATLIKPNLKELMDVFIEDIKDSKADYARKILLEHDINYCLLTLGKDGMLLVSKETEKRFVSKKREVYDVSGAGDTVIATVAASYCTGAKMEDACFLSNVAAGVVVTKAGTSSLYPSEIRNEIELKSKVFKLSELVTQIDVWRENGYSIGFTNGCFDILHTGHIHTLTFAKKNCDKLIVGLNSDASVKRLKGADRPINKELDRGIVLAELGSVDGLIFFEEDTPENLIRYIKPDVLIKGADYKKEEIVGFNFLNSYGGQVLLAPLIENKSTTNLVSMIQRTTGT